ncbi:MAG: DUF4167 domain-containing protein, partial [Erythrobacter sp.]|nr:DUF4167 domain-containing protein [Erythrobacter sp.]
MRSSKSRSRSKSNRPRPMGNIVNRVFDSSGPDGKVRGTPQQIIEKYLFLARDAQLSNDRVAAENFNQHAEHYTRMLSEAQREMAAEQEARQSQPQQQNVQGGQYGQNGQNGQNGQPRDPQRDPQQHRDTQPRDQQPRRDDRDYRSDQSIDDQPYIRRTETIELAEAADDTGLIETPESRQGNAARRTSDQGAIPDQSSRPERPERRPDNRPRRAPPAASTTDAAPAEAAATETAAPTPKPRAPRKPRSEKPQPSVDK